MNNLLLTTIPFFCYFIMSALLTPIGILSPVMADHFALPIVSITETFGWLTVGNFFGALAAILLLGRVNLRTLFISVYGMMGAALLAFSVSDSLTVLSAVLLTVGFGSGIGLAAAALLISSRFSAAKKTSVLILTDGCFSIAGFVMSWLTAYALHLEFGWQIPLQFVGLVAILNAILALFSSMESIEFPATNPKWTLRGSYSPPAILFGAALFFYTLGQHSVLLWLPTYASKTLGMTNLDAGGLVGQFWAGMFLSQIFSSWWVLRIGTERLIGVAIYTALLGSITLWLTPRADYLGLVAGAWGFLNFSLLKAVLSRATEIYPQLSHKLIPALLLSATLGTSLSPFVTSMIVESFDVKASLIAGSIFHAVLLVCVASANSLGKRRLRLVEQT